MKTPPSPQVATAKLGGCTQGATASQGLLAALLDTEELSVLRSLVVARVVGPALAMPLVAAVLRERAGAGAGAGLHLLNNMGEWRHMAAWNLHSCARLTGWQTGHTGQSRMYPW